MAFAIPPRACIKPGPETTRQTPGLQQKAKSSFYIVHFSKDCVIGIKMIHYSIQLNIRVKQSSKYDWRLINLMTNK